MWGQPRLMLFLLWVRCGATTVQRVLRCENLVLNFLQLPADCFWFCNTQALYSAASVSFITDAIEQIIQKRWRRRMLVSTDTMIHMI